MGVYVQSANGQQVPQQQVVYVQQPQQIQQQQPKNNKNKKQKGFIGKIFGNTPKHIMNETESVLGTNTTNSIKNDAKYVNKEANSQINKAANAFNKEANSAFNSLFGT